MDLEVNMVEVVEIVAEIKKDGNKLKWSTRRLHRTKTPSGELGSLFMRRIASIRTP